MAPGFEEVEAVTPIDLLRRAGVEVVTVGVLGRRIVGARGLVVEADLEIAEVTEPWDAVVLPGGLPGATHLAEASTVARLLDQAQQEDRWIAAICAAPVRVLGASGRLSGRRYTGYPGIEGPSDAQRVEASVVMDGRLVTSQGVGTAADFALALIEVLVGSSAAEAVARATLLTPRR